MNVLLISGVTGSDTKTAYTPSGLAIASFSMAYSESKKDAQGHWVNSPAQWWSCKIFGKYAERLMSSGKLPKKGERVIVEGSVQLREYEDKTGAKRTSHDILVKSMVLIPKQQAAEVPAEAPLPEVEESKYGNFTEADVPF